MALPAMLRSLRHHNYRLWAAADLISVTGTWMQVLALNWLVLSITHSATSVGLGLLLQAVPTLALAPLGGAIADRLPARRVVMAGQSVQMALSALLALLAAGDPSGPMGLYAISFVSGAVTALTSPSLARFGMEIVGPEDLSNALSLGSVLSSGGRILGMSLAGVVIAVVGVPGAFAANAASFAAVLAALILMRHRELHEVPKAAPGERGVVAGLRHVLRTPWLLVTLGLAFVLGSLGRNYQVTMAAMSDGPLHGGAGGYGALSVLFAVGTVLGGLFAASRSRLSLALLPVMAVACSVGQMASGVAPNLPVFGALMLPIAAAAVVIDTTVSTRVQLDSPGGLRGRVIAAQGMVGAASGAAGGPALGAMCDLLGPRAALVLAGAVSVTAALAAGAALLRLRRKGALARTGPDQVPAGLPHGPAPRRMAVR
ncbi:MFS transporter [Actinomadura sp. NBRC 104412]|uniref:MFS transporter n=1 Tax=Actinomadura sp. NBRC 104412 TaxID=3032203 RepID=UPI0024A4B071|nr:MFS transporter [Actinomadura sp. NBRC 104412]GLZ03221.1 MFS transporter [Actinomadura sp. NBRC 104412]